MAQAAFETTAASDSSHRVAEASPAPAMRGVVFAVLLSLPIWFVALYVLYRVF